MSFSSTDKPRSGGKAIAAVWIFLSTLLAILPLLSRGNSFGHDFDFHLLSWMETAKNWHQGVPYPHWLESANYGAGEPRFIFYPPATWMLGAVLGSLTSWTAAPMLFIFCSLFFSGLSLYLLARHWMPEGAAIFAACLYTANPYALFNVYERSAYGEVMAGVWMPLLLLFALRRPNSIAPLALVTAAIWLTNAPAAVVAGYSLGVVAVVAALVERKWWPLTRAALGTALGMGVASFYLVPAAYERRWVKINRLLNPDLRPEDSFLFRHGRSAFHAEVVRTASWIAVAMLVSTAIVFVVCWMNRKSSAEKRLVVSCFALTVAITFLLLPWSAWVWRVAPEMPFLQFPWRWLLMQAVVLTVMMGLAVANTRLCWNRLVPGFVAIVILAAVVGVGNRFFFQGEDEDDTFSSQVANFDSGHGVEGTDEYTPVNAFNPAIQKQLPMVRLLDSPIAETASTDHGINPTYVPGAVSSSIHVTVYRWRAENKIVQVETPSAGFAVLRLVDYPGWKVLVNSSEQTARPQRKDGLIVVAVPQGTARIEIVWRRTPDAIVGSAISIVSIFLLLPVALLERRKESEARV